MEKKIIEIADRGTEIFEKEIASIQKVVFGQLVNLIKGLDTDKDGNIKQTTKNFKLISSVRKINKIILNKRYRKAVGDYIELFNKSRKVVDSHIDSMPKDAV